MVPKPGGMNKEGLPSKLYVFFHVALMPEFEQAFPAKKVFGNQGRDTL
jgi:hypothetical protein